ncbi:MAG TPA: hypothetical protein VN520_34105 [Streptomyces sp.]|uniref:hypothetical protein n=1 Tax=Streptomyces sp. TaxID=1931 RepID=UPI002BA16627|nr:hypothetical protein [Streptomyces sp.]HWU11336.1 hypothetical protein [Streptomyces sp.]
MAPTRGRPGESVFAVDYTICSRCRLEWVEQPHSDPPCQRCGLATAGLAALRAEHPGIVRQPLGGHFTDSQVHCCVLSGPREGEEQPLEGVSAIEGQTGVVERRHVESAQREALERVEFFFAAEFDEESDAVRGPPPRIVFGVTEDRPQITCEAFCGLCRFG